jgi:hypothetical protein
MFYFALEGANSEGGNTWVHIRTPMDLYPQLQPVNMAECIDTSKESRPKTPTCAHISQRLVPP